MYNDETLYADGARLPLGDGSIRLCRVKTRDEKRIRIYGKKTADGKHLLCMASGIENDDEAYRTAVTGWLRNYARIKLGEKAHHFAIQMQVTINRIAIKEQKTRWGSCSSLGNLNFNWKLVLMPESIQDYVVVHELAHRKQMNHSGAFWQEVAKALPDYNARRKWLKEHEHEFIKY